MMLGRGVRGLGTATFGSWDCIQFNLSDIQQAMGSNPDFGVNLYQVMSDSGGEGGCIADKYIPYLSQDYIDSHRMGTSPVSPMTLAPPPPPPPPPAPAPMISAPVPISLQPILTVGQDSTPIAPSPMPPTSAPSETINPGLPPVQPINVSSTSTSAAAATAVPGTIFGINSTYVLIGGAVLAFMFLGGKK